MSLQDYNWNLLGCNWNLLDCCYWIRQDYNWNHPGCNWNLLDCCYWILQDYNWNHPGCNWNLQDYWGCSLYCRLPQLLVGYLDSLPSSSFFCLVLSLLLKNISFSYPPAD